MQLKPPDCSDCLIFAGGHGHGGRRPVVCQGGSSRPHGELSLSSYGHVCLFRHGHMLEWQLAASGVGHA